MTFTGNAQRDRGEWRNNEHGSNNANPWHWRLGRHSRPRAHHRSTGLQPLARTARSACHPSLHRHGLWLQRLLAALVQGHRHHARYLLHHEPCLRFVHHQLQLACLRSRLDLHAVLRASRLFGRYLGRLAGACGAAQGRFRLGLLLVRRHSRCCPRGLHPPALADVARRRCHRRYRSGPWLYLPGFHPDQMVSRPARHGNGHGDHGLWRRRHDRRTACQPFDDLFPHRYVGRRLADLRRHGHHLFRLHDGRRLRLPHPAGRLASGRLDCPRLQEHDDHHQARASARCP